jgi:penicillin G amidase
MKVLKKILLSFLFIILIVIAGIYFYLLSTKPKYSGELKLKGLKESVDVYFDKWGIPHIYAKNEEDAYYALGYVHAQDRLFQMEILRRVGSGRLAEILGKDVTKIDAFFRTLGIAESAKKSAALYLGENKEPYQKDAFAYLAGVNRFIETGKTPVEFTILRIPKENFKPEDFYFITGYMSFSFASALKNDPVLTKILKQYGKNYLDDISPFNPDTVGKFSLVNKDSLKLPSRLASTVDELLNKIPLAPFIGSNGWVIAPSKSKSGKVLFANDTHIAYSQPSVWYEAHIEYPGFSFYGNYLGGFPFALVGHTKKFAWGLTMLENDDMDLFREKQNPGNENQYWINDHWENYELRNETIKIKGGPDSSFQIKITRHGPVINSVTDNVKKNESGPVSVWWSFTKFSGTTLQATYNLNHAERMNDFRIACSMIEAPGLNVLYGDAEGNIAWWACAKLVKRSSHVNSKVILDGAGGADEPLGFYPFSENPYCENPSCGFVYSANNSPDTSSKNLFPGYYAPADRGQRIFKFLNANKKFTKDDMHKINSDVVSEVHKAIAFEMVSVIENEPKIKNSELNRVIIQLLKTWDGNHRLDNSVPTIYYKLLSYILEMTMKDEIGKDDFPIFEISHTMKNAYKNLILNDSSSWWDNIETKAKKETRKEIFAEAFSKTVSDLQKQFGDDPSAWTWDKAHTNEYVHLIGRQKPFDKIFNVGPLPAPGGSETINNAGFPLNTDGNYKVSYGPAMRIVIDFAEVENAESILPTGQSGNLMSPHYADQKQLYMDCKSRKMMMDKEEIEKNSEDKLELLPE